ncbi:MAG: diguanylate cyclase [Planctomycetota bacterium]
MLLFIAITATLNLCLGYALGVYIGEFPGLSASPRRKPVDPPNVDFDLSMPEEEPAPAPRTTPAKAKAPTPVAEPEPAPAEPEPTPSAAEPAAAADSSKPSHAEVMDGLAAFQAQLAKMGAEMKDTVEDEQAFGECTGRLQQANHDYLEQAQTTIDELGEDPADEAAAACRDVIEENAKLVSERSEEIDSLLADGAPDEAARTELIAKTESLSESVAEAEQKIEAVTETAAGEGAAPPKEESAEAEAAPKADRHADKLLDPESRLATIATLQQAIDEELNAGGNVVIATVRRDPLDAQDAADSDLESRLLATLTDMAGEVLSDTHLMAPSGDDRLLMLLSGDTGEEASQRVERLRQQVEKTTFSAGKGKLQATVTCGVAESDESISREELLELADEAIAESERHGVNRSYHHDGRFPAPVIPEDYAAKSKTVSI